MSICIIGSNSFSGSSFARYALELGETVICVSRSPEKKKVFLPYRQIGPTEKLVFRRMDLNQDLDSLQSCLKEFKPKVVINFAAQSMVAESWEHPWDWYETNVTSLSKLTSMLSNVDFLDTYVHFSTPEVYGSTEGIIAENFNFKPSTPYAVSRAAADWHLRNLFEIEDFPVIFTRASNIYGPGQPLYRVIPRLVHSTFSGQKFFLDGGGQSVRNFIHSNDVVTALEKIISDGISGDSYHISSDEFISIRQLSELVCDFMGVKFDEVVRFRAERPGKDKFYQLDASKLESLGWAPAMTLADGLETVISWYKSGKDEFEDDDLYYKHKA